jgi:hypothetical protein
MNGTTTENEYTGMFPDLTQIGTVTRTTDVPPNYSGYSRNSASYGPTGNYLYVSSGSGAFNIYGADQELSVACWFRSSDLTQDMIMISKNSTQTTNVEYQLWIEADDDKLRGTISSDGTTLTTAIGATTFQEDIWYHVAMVYDDTDIRLYVNGVLDSNGSDNPKAYTAGIYDGTAGGAGYLMKMDPVYFLGDIDEAITFDGALTSGEVLNLFNDGITGDCGGSD